MGRGGRSSAWLAGLVGLGTCSKGGTAPFKDLGLGPDGDHFGLGKVNEPTADFKSESPELCPWHGERDRESRPEAGMLAVEVGFRPSSRVGES